MASSPVVCCVKWGTKYPASYANRLGNMVRRHLPGPYDFVCLTDDPTGLDSDIRPIRLPDASFTGFWTKISLFRSDLFEPGRTVLYFDVDVVILGPLDFMLKEQSADLTIVRAFSENFGFNSSVMRFRAGALSHVYDRFSGNAAAIVASGDYSGDQSWIHAQVPGAALFPAGKIVSYKKDMRSHLLLAAKKLGLDLPWLKAPHWMTVSPPAGASIVVFHGKPDPEDVMDAPYGPWKRAPFVKEHWR
jgi:hypothetical protein